MKTRKVIQFLFFSLILTSCSPSVYYQVCKTTPDLGVKQVDGFLVYEDTNCKVIYDLWENHGNIGFSFFNKTSANIYLNLAETFFVINGNAKNYYKNRVYSHSTSIGTGATLVSQANRIGNLKFNLTNSVTPTTISTQGSTVSFNEEKVICIPSMAFKSIKEYDIMQSPYQDCDLVRFPTKRNIKTLTFTNENSPIVLSNRIEYKVGEAGKSVNIANNFFVSEITNYPKSEIIELKRQSRCGEEVEYPYLFSEYFKSVSPDKFYVRYLYDSNQDINLIKPQSRDISLKNTVKMTDNSPISANMDSMEGKINRQRSSSSSSTNMSEVSDIHAEKASIEKMNTSKMTDNSPISANMDSMEGKINRQHDSSSSSTNMSEVNEIHAEKASIEKMNTSKMTDNSPISANMDSMEGKINRQRGSSSSSKNMSEVKDIYAEKASIEKMISEGTKISASMKSRLKEITKKIDLYDRIKSTYKVGDKIMFDNNGTQDEGVIKLIDIDKIIVYLDRNKKEVEIPLTDLEKEGE